MRQALMPPNSKVAPGGWHMKYNTLIKGIHTLVSQRVFRDKGMPRIAVIYNHMSIILSSVQYWRYSDH